MSRFDKGVTYYTTGKAVIKIHFPEDAVCCQFCPFIRAESELKRYKCRLTERMIYGLNYIDEYCPIEFEEVENV